MTDSIANAFKKAFDPQIVITARNLDKGTNHKTILKEVEKVLRYTYETMLDDTNGNLYIGKKV